MEEMLFHALQYQRITQKFYALITELFHAVTQT